MSDVHAWEDALAACDLTQRDLDDLGFDYADVEIDLLGTAHTSAMLAMAATPAPDSAAFVRKFELLVAAEMIEACGPAFEPALVALLADARRLGGL
jgi:hypothetical protein